MGGAYCGLFIICDVAYDFAVAPFRYVVQLSLTAASVKRCSHVAATGNQCPPMRALDSNVTRGFTCSTGEVLNSESSNTNVPRCRESRQAGFEGHRCLQTGLLEVFERSLDIGEGGLI